MQEENRHSSAICAVVIMFSAMAADSAVEMNTGAAFEKNNGYIAAQRAAERSAWKSFAAKYPTGRRDIEWEQWTVFQNAQSEYSAIIYALCTGKMGLYAEI